MNHDHLDASISQRTAYLFRAGKPKKDARKSITQWFSKIDEQGCVEITSILSEFHSMLMRPELGDHDGIVYCKCRVAAILRDMEQIGQARKA